jgi:hypothetical protein
VLSAGASYAQATRTWVSGVGDDANPCSRTAPCKTFPGAISKTAAGGVISVLDPGGFGGVTITKSITLDGSAGLGGILASGTNGITINAAGAVVILRNLDINGIGSGLNGVGIIAAQDVYVENSKVYGFTGRGISDERSSGRLFLSDVTISANGTAGIGAASAAPNRVTVTGTRVRLERNGNAGLIVANGAVATFADSVLSGNVNFGAYTSGSGTQLDLESCISSVNGTGVQAVSGAVIRLSNTTVSGNSTGLYAPGGSIDSYGNNRIAGNAAGNGPPSGSVALQ